MKAVQTTCLTPGCGKQFLKQKRNHQFCSRRCFKKAYYHRIKAVQLKNQKCPSFLCPGCGRDILLGFDPVIDNFKWLAFVCPHCAVLMISVCEEIVTQDTPSI